VCIDPDIFQPPQGLEKRPGSVPKMIEIQTERSDRPTGLTPRWRVTMVSARGARQSMFGDGVNAQVLLITVDRSLITDSDL
jgi:hypothetical protein